ncbi:MAG TPA: DUF72 domain-containing protein [Patescibacteria group bacterium]|nr:DUF72 domain-containing protein [Patescibacteria group bacterium]
MKAYIGTSGWQYKHWNKRFFPEDLPRIKQLWYLSRKFDTVELNTTFYHFARSDTFLKWANEVPSRFVFSVKMNRLFTHFKRLKLDVKTKRDLHVFLGQTALLGNKLGPVLIQLPPSFKADIGLLAAFIKQLTIEAKKLRVAFKFAIEFRHETWFTSAVYTLLKKEKIALVITNSPHWPFVIMKTAPFVYIRFHGRSELFASNYTNKELREWAEKLRALKSRTIYAYFNNDANAYAAENAMYLQKLFESKA